MLKIRVHNPIPAALTPGLVNILLTGDDFGDPFLIFDVDLRDGGGYLPRLWREHRTWLVAEWRRRGGTGDPWILRGHYSPLRLVEGQWIKSDPWGRQFDQVPAGPANTTGE